MKSFLKLLAAGVVALTVSETYAQTRDIGAQRILLDDGNGGVLTVWYQGPGDGEFIIPPGGGSAAPNGSVTGQTLAWDNGMSQWQVMSNLMNAGGNVSMPSGNFAVADGTISGTASGEDAGLAIQHTGTGFGINVHLTNTDNPSHVIYASTAGAGMGVSAVATSGIGGAFRSADNHGVAGISTNGNGVYGSSLTSGMGVYGISTSGQGVYGTSSFNYGVEGTSSEGIGVRGASATNSAGLFEAIEPSNVYSALVATTAGTGHAGEFTVTNTESDGSAVRGFVQGLGNAGEFIVDNTAHSDYAVEALTNGQGSAGAFTNTNSTNAGVALQGMTFGTSEAIGVWGWADEGIGGEFQGPVYGVNGISTSSGAGVHGISYEGNAGEFEIDNVNSNGNAVSGHTNGLGNAGEFIVDNTTHSDYAVEGLTNGLGSAGAFTNVNPTNETTALQGMNHGTANAVGVWGWADEGTGGHFQGGSMGAKMQGPIAAQFTGSTTGILVAEGRLIGSSVSLVAGETIPDNVMIVNITATNGGADDNLVPQVFLPTGGEAGQMLIVGTTDPNGAAVSAVNISPNVAYMYVNINGTWMRTP